MCAGHIRAIHKGANALYDVVLSHNIVLKNEEVQTSINSNKTLIETVESLTKPINNCRVALRQLIAKLKRLRISCLEFHDVRSTFGGLNKSLFSKTEISKLLQNTERREAHYKCLCKML